MIFRCSFWDPLRGHVTVVWRGRGGEGGWGSFLHFLEIFWDSLEFWEIFGILQDFEYYWRILEGFLGDSLGCLKRFYGILWDFLRIFGGFWRDSWRDLEDSWEILWDFWDFEDSWGIFFKILEGIVKIFGILWDFDDFWGILEGFLRDFWDPLGFWVLLGDSGSFLDRIMKALEGFLGDFWDPSGFWVLLEDFGRILEGFFGIFQEILSDPLGFWGFYGIFWGGGFWDFSKDYWGIQLSRVWWTSAETSLKPWNNIENNR